MSQRCLRWILVLLLIRITSVAQAQAEAPRPTRTRLGAEIGGATLGTLVGLGLSLGVYRLTYDSSVRNAEPDDDDKSWGAMWAGVTMGSLVGVGALPALAAAGTFLPGRALGGRGRFGWSLLGAHLGSLAGFAAGFGFVFGVDLDLFAYGLPACVLVGTVAGAVGAYEWSSHRRLQRKDRIVASLQPALHMQPDASGGALTLRGRF